MMVLKQIIDAAKRAHPAFRFATAVAGLGAFIILFLKYGLNGATLALGVIVFIALMTLFVVFARLTKIEPSTLALPAKAMLWTSLILALAALCLLFISTFFNWPIPIKSYLLGIPPIIPEPKLSSYVFNETGNLFAHYSFEKSSNLGFDSSNNENHGSNSGVVSQEGIIGNAAFFNGKSKIEVESFRNFVWRPEFSVSVWFKRTGK